MEDRIALPPGWVQSELGHLGNWSGGGTPSKAEKAFWADGTIPWVSPKDMKTARIRTAEDFITSDAVANSSAKLIPAKSILMVTRSGILAHTFPVAVSDCEATVNQDLKTLTPSSGIEPDFLAWYLRGYNRDLLQTCAKHGTTVASIDSDRLKKYPVLLAPTNEQSRIVEKIETLFARLDQGEADLRQVQTLLARYRQSILKAAVTGQLTADWRAENAHRLEHGRDLLARILKTRHESWQGRGKYKEPVAPDTTGLPKLPKGWVWTTLESLGFVKSGQTPKGIDEHVDPKGSIPWFKVSSMNEPGNEVELRESKWMFSEESAKSAKLNLLPQGTIVFPKRGGAILTNKKRRLGKLGGLDLNTMGFVPVALDDYLWAFFQGLDLRTIYDGSNVPQINYYDIADVSIALPTSEEEASVIAEIVEATLEQQTRLELWCKTELTRSTALRQSILKQAFAGRLVPQDPNDEPASELLARIRAASEQAPKQGKARRKAKA